MAQEPTVIETPVEPSIDRDADKSVGNETGHRSIDDIALDLATRGGKEMKKDEASHSLFTK